MEWVAHRGASHDAPENTLASVRLAWEQSADAVEIDVRLSRDQVVVAFHDADTMRICGSDQAVSDLTYDELRCLDAGAGKGDAWKGERIPTLEEVLETVPQGKRLLVEIKTGPEILPRIWTLLEKHPARAQSVTLIGFDEDVMRAAREQNRSVRILWVRDMEHDPIQDVWIPRPKELIEKASLWGFDGLDVRACPGVDHGFVHAVSSAGLLLYVWTVDDPAEALRLRDAGVTGITTNRPAWLRSECRL
ncbi:MAG: glycerophosphodiester phosphodiesterase [Planctomycetota bacterium]